MISGWLTAAGTTVHYTDRPRGFMQKQLKIMRPFSIKIRIILTRSNFEIDHVKGLKVLTSYAQFAPLKKKEKKINL